MVSWLLWNQYVEKIPETPQTPLSEAPPSLSAVLSRLSAEKQFWHQAGPPRFLHSSKSQPVIPHHISTSPVALPSSLKTLSNFSSCPYRCAGPKYPIRWSPTCSASVLGYLKIILNVTGQYQTHPLPTQKVFFLQLSPLQKMAVPPFKVLRLRTLKSSPYILHS